jgi:hypothetical protein
VSLIFADVSNFVCSTADIVAAHEASEIIKNNPTIVKVSFLKYKNHENLHTQAPPSISIMYNFIITIIFRQVCTLSCHLKIYMTILRIAVKKLGNFFMKDETVEKDKRGWEKHPIPDVLKA